MGEYARPTCAAFDRGNYAFAISSPRHRRGKAAFTLLELIVVMVLITVIVGIAAPSLSNFGQGRRIGDSADQIVVLARWARSQAISRGIAFRLNFDPSQNAYWLTMQSGPAYANILQADPSAPPSVNTYDQLGEEYGKRFAAPGNVTLTCTALAQQDGQYVEFYPTGRCDPATVRLTDVKGQVIEVGCLLYDRTMACVERRRTTTGTIAAHPAPGTGAMNV